MDKLAIHITFHYKEQCLDYLHKIINEALAYPFETHIFNILINSLVLIMQKSLIILFR